MTSRVLCADCGYENSPHRTTCKKCHVNLEEAQYKASQATLTGERLSIEERSEILGREINRYVRQGYRVVSRTDTTAQLVKPKEFSLFWAIIGFLFLYLLYYLSKKDETLYLEVLPNGQIAKT